MNKGEVKNNYWPVDTSFHVNFVGDAFEQCKNLEGFITLFKEAINELTGRSHLQFVIKSEFSQPNNLNSFFQLQKVNHKDKDFFVNLNIKLNEIGLNYTCGSGRNLYTVKSAREHNMALCS